MQNFVHLRAHSEFSVTDGILQVKKLIDLCGNDKMPAIALTDLHNLFALVKFYKLARSSGIKPIIGCELSVNSLANPNQEIYRIILLVKNQEGLRELNRLITDSFLHNKHRDLPLVAQEWILGKTFPNLIALSGGVYGDIAKSIHVGKLDEAKAKIKLWKTAFPDSYYLELQRFDYKDCNLVFTKTLELAEELDCPVVATHPIQFATAKDFVAHEVRICIADSQHLDDESRVRKFSEDQYFLTQKQMINNFSDVPEAILNTVEIAKRCNLELTLGQYFLPKFEVDGGIAIEDYLLQQALVGLEQRLAQIFPDSSERESKYNIYKERLQIEVEIINQMGFAGYFLIVADFINYAKNNQIPVGPGRGSGAGSLVAFCLAITDIDPLRYGLLFERFLNPERVSMPDFDIDFCQDKRELVIEYVKGKYGSDAVSQIATFGTMSSKAVIKDVGRVLNLPYGLCDSISKLILNTPVKSYSLQEACEKFPDLNERIINADDEVKRLWDLSLQLEDLTRNIGKHAAGVLIAPSRLTDFCPLYVADGMQTSQLDKDDVEEIGLVKFDFLGLRNLTIIQETLDNIKALYNKDVVLSTHDFTDKKTYQLLKLGNTSAIFQLESLGMRRVLIRLEPDRFEDIIALLALYRPGPLGSGMVDDFVRRKKGEEEPNYFHDDLKPCLETTYGVIVYQEQVMQISQIIGGYTLGGADLLRRAMGKKKSEEMAKHRNLFISGALDKGYSQQLAEELFDLMAKFAEYGFNKSHSAAYAVVSYHTAYLKAHYMSCFMAATLSSELDKTDKLYEFYLDCKDNKLNILAPDINSSEYSFKSLSDNTISYALGAIKGVGQMATQLIVDERLKNGLFESFIDFCKRMDKKVLNKKTLESLVKAGAFDLLEANRAKLFTNIPKVLDDINRINDSQAQASLFGDSLVPEINLNDTPVWGLREQLKMEKQALGYYFSANLFDEYRDVIKKLEFTELSYYNPENEKLANFIASSNAYGSNRSSNKNKFLVRVCGMINYIGSRPLKSGGKMTFVRIEDDTAEIECVLFAEEFSKYHNLIKIDECIVVEGELSYDSFRAQIKIMVKKIYTIDEVLQSSIKKVIMQIDHNFDPNHLKELTHNQGHAEVILRYRNQDAVCQVEFGQEYKFISSYSNTMQLNKLLGKIGWDVHLYEEWKIEK